MIALSLQYKKAADDSIDIIDIINSIDINSIDNIDIMVNKRKMTVR